MKLLNISNETKHYIFFGLGQYNKYTRTQNVLKWKISLWLSQRQRKNQTDFQHSHEMCDSFLFVLLWWFNTQKKKSGKKRRKNWRTNYSFFLFSSIRLFGKQFVNNVLIQRKLIDFSVDWLCVICYLHSVCITSFLCCVYT